VVIRAITFRYTRITFYHDKVLKFMIQ